MKEESGNFLCPKCGDKLFGSSHVPNLQKWVSREYNGVKKFIFYGEDTHDYPLFRYYWYGRIEESFHPSDTDSEDSCGIKRHIHLESWTEHIWIKNDSIESCWKEAFTDKEWNKYFKISCGNCKYKSNFLDFIHKSKIYNKKCC